MTESNQARIVTTRARRAVQEYLDTFRNTETLMDHLGTAVKSLSDVGEEILPALNEALDDPHAMRRLYAAWFLLGIADQAPGAVDQRFRDRAASAVVEILQRGNSIQRQLTCGLFSISGGAPTAATPIWASLLKDKDEGVRVSAAAALCASGKADATSVPILSKGLRSADDLLVTMAAHALGKLGVQEVEAVRQLVAAISEDGTSHQAFCVDALVHLGLTGQPALPQLMSLCLDNKASPYVRGRAALAIGRVTRGTSTGHKVLLKALRSSQWQVVDGALEGFRLNNEFPEGVAACLAPHLSSDNEMLRKIATVGISESGPQARTVLPALLARIGQETNIHICDALAAALAAVGNEVIPLLIERVRRANALELPVIAMTLKRLGEAAAAEVANSMFGDPDVAVRAFGVGIMRELGPRAAPAVPTMARMLAEADDESTLYLLTAILACGMAATQATAAVVRCLVTRNEELAWFALRILRQLGQCALDELQSASKGATGSQRSRITQALRELSRGNEQHFNHLQKLGHDDWLKAFAVVGEILLEQGPTSWRDIEQIVKERKKAGLLPIGMKGESEPYLRGVCKKLSRAWNEALSDHARQKKGGLTDAGKRRLQEVQEYLRSSTD